jgi:hypothetical protein
MDVRSFQPPRLIRWSTHWPLRAGTDAVQEVQAAGPPRLWLQAEERVKTTGHARSRCQGFDRPGSVIAAALVSGTVLDESHEEDPRILDLTVPAQCFSCPIALVGLALRHTRFHQQGRKDLPIREAAREFFSGWSFKLFLQRQMLRSQENIDFRRRAVRLASQDLQVTFD